MPRPVSRRWPLRAALVSLVLVAAISLAGCAGASPPVNVTAATFGNNATGTVVTWARSNTITAATPLVKEFNATHPRLKVVMDSIQDTQAVTELATAIRGHAAPDLVDLNDIYMPIFTQLDAFVNLTSAISKLPYVKDLSPGHLALASYDNRVYGVPYLADLSVLWINKTLFKRSGLTRTSHPGTSPRSWPTPARSMLSGTGSAVSPSPAIAPAASVSLPCPTSGRRAPMSSAARSTTRRPRYRAALA